MFFAPRLQRRSRDRRYKFDVRSFHPGRRYTLIFLFLINPALHLLFRGGQAPLVMRETMFMHDCFVFGFGLVVLSFLGC